MKALARPKVDLDRVADMIVKAAVRLAGAENGSFIRREPDGWVVGATYGTAPLVRGERMQALPGSNWGRAVLGNKSFHYADTKLAQPRLADAGKRRTRMAVPIVHGGESIGVLTMSRDEPGGFDKTTIALIETFADQLAVAMENARLLSNTKESLEHQTALADILRVIAESNTELNATLTTLLDRARVLCAADGAAFYRPVTGGFELLAMSRVSPYSQKEFAEGRAQLLPADRVERPDREA